jgi:hypothetical protein
MAVTAVMRGLCDSRAEMVGATRFFRNPKVSAAEIMATAAARTAEAAAGRSVLLIADTSEINFEAKAGRKRGLGRVGNGTDVGLFVHPAVVVDAEGSPMVLGLAGASIWARTKTKAVDYQSQPIETKESYRWIEAALGARAALAGAPVVTVVHDRESDIYEVFARVPQLDAARPLTHLVVRSHYDRALAGPGGRLNARVAGWPVLGTTRFEMDARPGRPARPVTLELRAGSVALRRPKLNTNPADPSEVTLTVVDAQEIDAPPGQDPVHWRLLTTHPAVDIDQALAVVEIYRRRWIVEQLFRTLKSQGLGIEDSFIADGQALENLAAAALVAATQVMQCVQARGEAGQLLPATRVFAPQDIGVLEVVGRSLEGRTQKQKNPHPPHTLAWAVWVVARLGGWKGYQTERPPGPITMVKGLRRYRDIAQGFTLARG